MKATVKITAWALTVCVLVFSFASCSEECSHSWAEANCYAPQYCLLCGTIGEPKNEHSWEDANCHSPARCTYCNAVTGDALEHKWTDADCNAPSLCSLCGETKGEALEHKYVYEITKTADPYNDGVKTYTCTVCGDAFDEKYSAEKLSPSEIFDLAKQCVGVVKVSGRNFTATGTGFLVSSDGKIVTNYHVIENYRSITVTIGETVYPVTKVLASSEEKDLALLKIDGSDFKYLETQTYGVSVGDTVYAFGTPVSYENTLTKGIVCHPEREAEGKMCIQHDASITHGNSGGPLFNEYGQVIGINAFGYEDSQNLNFAISVSELDYALMSDLFHN